MKTLNEADELNTCKPNNLQIEKFTESVTNKLEDLAFEVNNIKEIKPYSIFLLEIQ